MDGGVGKAEPDKKHDKPEVFLADNRTINGMLSSDLSLNVANLILVFI